MKVKLISEVCLNYVKNIEGFEPIPKPDMVGVMTLGYGMTGEEIKGLTSITEEKASEMLEGLLNKKYAKALLVDLDAKKIELKQNEFDALVSMAYNIGVEGVLSSTLYKDVCKGVRTKSIITKDFQAWCKGEINHKLVVIPGLLRRRTEEAKMFLEGGKFEYENNPYYGVVIAKDGLNIRSSMDSKSKDNILGVLPFNTKVKIDKKVGNWYSIYYSSHGGYVSAQYVNLI